MRKVKAEDVQRYEQGLLSELRGKKGEAILKAVRADKQLKPETEEKLKALLENYGKVFA